MFRRRGDGLIASAMLAPAIAILSIFVVYPLGRAVWLGHLRCDATGRKCRTSGWMQYFDVLRSGDFQHALKVTFVYALLTVPAGLVIGVGLAVLADKQIRGIGFFRTIFSSTVATSVAVASLIWFVLLQPQVGLLPDMLSMFGVMKNPGLLNDAGTALPAIAITSIWANLGFTFIIVTAALQSIPAELFESAMMDGAGGWKRFTNVTIPMLSPTLLFVSVVLVTRAFQAYAEVDLLTKGGPNPERSTETVTYLIYGQTSLVKNDIGLKSTTAVLLFVILLVLSLVQFRSLERRVHYGN